MIIFTRQIILAVSLFCVAQAEEHQSLPAPYLKPDGSKPAGQENRFVFLLPSSGDAVVLYPRVREDGSSDPTDVVRVQVELCRHVEPSVTTEVRLDNASGTFDYSYTLQNGKSARQAAWRWLLENVSDEPSVVVTAPEKWTYQVPKIKSKHLPVPADIQERDILFRSLQIFASDEKGSPRPTLGIQPGAQLEGLKLHSQKRPGLLDVYVQGGLAVPAFPVEPPEEAGTEIGAVISSLYNYRHTFCYGPRFDENASAATIARSFSTDLNRLTSAEVLPANSAFVARGKVLLANLSSEGVASLMPQIHAWASSAQTISERQFAAMLLLALPQQ